jgi:uncharacterized membrane protein
MSNETSRIEAFSDGVFGIAITLLILEIKIPPVNGGDLRMQLMRQWPSYVSYLMGFTFIGIMWINHHRLFTHIHRSDHMLLVFNLLLLLGVTTVPFPTAVLASHLGHPDQRAALIFFDATFVFIAIFFNLLWRHASSPKRQLLDPKADHSEMKVRNISSRYAVGPIAYLTCLGLAWISVPASLVLNFALVCYFAVPPSNVVPVKNRSVEIAGDVQSE